MILASMPRRYRAATLLQILAPLSWTFGVWLIFPNLHINGSACLTCFSLIGAGVVTSPGAIVQTTIGSVFFLIGVLMSISSIGILAPHSDRKGVEWLRWLGRWKPTWTEKAQDLLPPEKYRSLALASLFVNLVAAVLVISGIGEARQFSLNQFFDLWGTLWYLYVFAVPMIGLITIYKRRVGGYFLSLILSLIAIGMVIPDLLGLLPPQPPTLQTSLILASQLPVSAVCIYASFSAIARIPERG